jgi:hypothetical protein
LSSNRPSKTICNFPYFSKTFYFFPFLRFFSFYFFPLLLCWGEYTVAFTKIFTTCQMYHTCFTPSTIPLNPPSLDSLLQLHACVHIFCTVFVFLPPFLATSLLPLVSMLYPGQDLFCPPFFLILHKRKE